jgi:hypothetical protein
MILYSITRVGEMSKGNQGGQEGGTGEVVIVFGGKDDPRAAEIVNA